MTHATPQYRWAFGALDEATSLRELDDVGACIAQVAPQMTDAERAMLRGGWEYNRARLLKGGEARLMGAIRTMPVDDVREIWSREQAAIKALDDAARLRVHRAIQARLPVERRWKKPATG